MRTHVALTELRAIRKAYGAEAGRKQRALLRTIASLRLARWSELARLHDDLLFLCAFPASPAIHRLARAGLRSIAARVRALPRPQRALADNSGIAGSTTRHVFPFAIARWLAHAFPRETEIDWRNVEDPGALDRVFGALLVAVEREAFDDGEIGTRAFVSLARPSHAISDLHWVMEGVPSRSRSRVAEDWDAAEPTLVWRLEESRGSVTRNVLSGVAVTYRHHLRRPAQEVMAAIEQPLSSIERLPRRRAAQVAACGARRAGGAPTRSERDDVPQPRRSVVVRSRAGRCARGVGTLVSTAGALFIVTGFEGFGFGKDLAWSLGYVTMAGFVAIGIVTALLATEPARSAAIQAEHDKHAPDNPLLRLTRTAISAFSEFLTRETALVALAFVIFYKFCDAFAGAMTAPYVIDLGFSRTDYANIVKGLGLGATLIGGFAGGLVARAYPLATALWIGAFLRMASP